MLVALLSATLCATCAVSMIHLEQRNSPFYQTQMFVTTSISAFHQDLQILLLAAALYLLSALESH